MAERQPLTGNQVAKIIDNYNNDQYIKNEAYYEGKNIKLLSKDFDGKPDNRIPLPFGRKTVKDVVGYAYKPGNVTYQFTEKTPDETKDKLEEVFKFNDEPIVSGEIFEDSLVKGEGAELQYFADDMPQFVQIPREQCIFVYLDTVKDKLDYSIRYYTTDTVDSTGENVETKHAVIYYMDRIDFYETTTEKSTQDIDPQISSQQTTTDKDTANYRLVNSEPHFYGAVPLYPFRINSDWLGVFQPSIPIIDILDDFGSDSIANSIDRFNETLMLFSKKLDDDVAAKIKEYNIIDDLGDKTQGHFVEFLNRQMDITSTVEGFELFERLYYELTGVPNLHDDTFNSKSGIAMLYALVPFENQVTGYEMYFTRGLVHRVMLLNNLCQNLFNLKPAEVSLKWVRNLPMDTSTLIDDIVKLKQEGVLSHETLLKMFPASIVEDVDKEIARIAKQKAADRALFESENIKDDEDVEDEEK